MRIPPKIAFVLSLLLFSGEMSDARASETIAALAPAQPTAAPQKPSPPVTQEQVQTIVQQSVQQNVQQRVSEGLANSQNEILQQVDARVNRQLSLTFGLLNALLAALLVSLMVAIAAFWFWRRSLVDRLRNELEEKLSGSLKAELEREMLDLAYSRDGGSLTTLVEEPAQLKEMISLAMSVQNLVENTRNMLAEALQKQNQFAEQMRELFEYQTQEAQSLMQSGQYSEAIDLYDKALQLKASDPSVLRSQAEGFLQLHRYDEAISAFERAAESDPDNSELHYAKARCYALQGNAGEAMLHLKNAIDLDPLLKEKARAETDFSLIREDEWFQTIVVG